MYLCATSVCTNASLGKFFYYDNCNINTQGYCNWLSIIVNAVQQKVPVYYDPIKGILVCPTAIIIHMSI